MKKNVLLLGFTLSVIFAFGQSEKENYKTVVNEFEKNYNSKDYEAIFSTFSQEMKDALPLDKAKEFFMGLNQQVGDIKEREFVRYEQSYAAYKTTFEKTVFLLLLSVDDASKINGMFIRPYVEDNSPKPGRNTTHLILPFNGEWTVFWGGDSKEQNYHVSHKAQKNAIDVIITDDSGKSFKTDGKTNEDYYAFGKELMAPCDAEVVLVVDGVKDNVPGTLNPMFVSGNTVILKAGENEYLFFAHFKQHSIVVKEGQKVKRGELLGLCGNSGNSSEAHLHFHIQNIEDMNAATGIKCYFNKLQVNGELKTDYSPVKTDKISNVKG